MVILGRTHSTKEVAEKVGVHPITLHKWVAAGKVRPSQRLGAKGDLRWTDEDVERVGQYKKEFFRVGQGKRNDLKGKKKVRSGKAKKN